MLLYREFITDRDAHKTAVNSTSFCHCHHILSHFCGMLDQPPEKGDTFPCSDASGSSFSFSEILTWVLGTSSPQKEGDAVNKPRSSRESCAWVWLYLQVPPGGVDVLLFVWVPRFCPVSVDGDRDQPSLLCPVGLIVEVPGFRVGLY